MLASNNISYNSIKASNVFIFKRGKVKLNKPLISHALYNVYYR